jgi:DNA-binding NtrC family response regulator
MSISDEDMKILMEYDWPGNIRELENMLERSVVMGTQIGTFLEELTRLKHASEVRDTNPASGPAARRLGGSLVLEDSGFYTDDMSLQEVEHQHIIRVLRKTGGNQRKAAGILGINPTTLWRKIKQYGIKVEGENVTSE